LGNPWSR